MLSKKTTIILKNPSRAKIWMNWYNKQPQWKKDQRNKDRVKRMRLKK